MNIKLVVPWMLMALLTACQTPSKAPAIAPTAKLYSQTMQALPAPQQLPPYELLYQSYLSSPTIASATEQWRAFEASIAEVDIAQCHTLPWQQQLTNSFWHLSFYRLALNCFNHHGDQANLKLFSAYQQYHLQGILSTGNGKTSTSAYRINSFADAHEVLNHLGMETQDYYADLNANGNALHYVVQAYDSNDNKFKRVFFQNQPYLYALEQYPYPFIGLVDGWNRTLLPEFAKANPILGLPLAQNAVVERRYADAITIYQQAIAADSLQARVEMAEMCFLATTPLKVQACNEALIEAADRDYVPAFELLLFLHHQGLLPKSTAKIKEDLRLSINEMAGPGQAEMALSRQYFNQRFGKRDADKGTYWLQQAVNAGHPQAEFYQVLWQLEQKKLSPEAANVKFRQMADAGSADAAFRAAAFLIQKQTLSPGEAKQAHTWLNQAKLAFFPEAEFLLAFGYELKMFPLPPGTDAQYIWQLYQSAATKFFPRAMNRLGEAYLTGDLVAKDAKLASRWFELCARMNSVSCAFNAGIMFDDGDGVKTNYADALTYFSFAAENGYAPAMNRLALMYLYGRGVPVNIEAGIKLLKAAAERGSTSSQLFLGVIYLEGKIVQQDIAEAKRFFMSAKENPKAAEFLQNWEAYVKKFKKPTTTSTEKS